MCVYNAKIESGFKHIVHGPYWSLFFLKSVRVLWPKPTLALCHCFCVVADVYILLELLHMLYTKLRIKKRFGDSLKPKCLFYLADVA